MIQIALKRALSLPLIPKINHMGFSAYNLF